MKFSLFVFALVDETGINLFGDELYALANVCTTYFTVHVDVL